jgi:AmmeMemoRadiSam system protein B
MSPTPPRLRPIEAFPVDVDGNRLICLRDPLEYAAGPVLVGEPTFFVAAHLDGTRSIVDIQAAFARRYGATVTAAEIDELILTLDRHHYLESPGFMARRSEVDGAFLSAAVRPPAHAGTSYPDDPAALRVHLDGFFAPLPARPRPRGVLQGLIAPHIDLRVGGTAYGHAYRALAETSNAERFIVLGTSHAPGTTLFAATRKDFATPLGTVTTDRSFLDRLAARMPGILYRDELLHRVEHAVEFQVVMLRHVLGDRPFTIVPILVTSFHEMIHAGRSPRDDGRVGEALAAVRATLAEDDVPTAIIAGVDFAHVGEKFGDPEGLAPALLDATEAKDRRLIAALEAVDAEQFAAEVVADADRTRICGFAPMYAFLRLIDAPGRLLHYDRTRDEATRSSVSYASMAFGLEDRA